MNEKTARERAGLAYVIGIVGAFLIVAVLVWAMIRYTQPAPLGQKRAEERAAALIQMHGEDLETNTVAWLNRSNGLVRLRIEDAMNLVEREWRHPEGARSNLIARVEKATAAPPKPPEKPSPFE